jgi:hypothetical protein
VSSEIVIEGNNSTITRDSGAPEFRILSINSSGNLTIQDTSISGGAAFSGAGVSNTDGTVTLTDSTISGNSADESGGGVYNLEGAAVLKLNNSTISGNSAGNKGGGIANSGGRVTITDSTLSGNTASTSGGALWSHSTIDGDGGVSTATLTNSTLSGNSALLGGGIYIWDYFPSTAARAALINSTVTGNSGFGGGIYNRTLSATSSVTVVRSLISGNSDSDSYASEV